MADLNALMQIVSLGLTRPGANATDTTHQNDATAFYVLKESVALKDMQAGWHSGAAGANYEAWGDAAHLAVYYDQITISQITTGQTLHKYGSGVNQVISESTSGTNWLFTGLGIAKDNNGNDASGTNVFGTDYFVEYHYANLALRTSGAWMHNTSAGVWAVDFVGGRSDSASWLSFRAACYPS